MAIPLVLLTLSLLGVLDATYLTYAHLFGAHACGAESGCGAVMASPYSRLFGIPLSTFGLGLYMAIAVPAWRGLRPAERDASIRWISLLALAGNLPTVVLLYLQAVVIDAWCPFCLVSAGLVLAILIVSEYGRRGLGPRASGRALSLSRGMIPVGLAIALPPLLFAGLEAGVDRARLDARTPPPEVVARIGERQVTLAEMDRGIRLRLQKVKDT